MSGLPLTGIRVLDYSQYVAGPLATMLLADLGADVIKVEPPRGDAWRHYASHAPGESTYFYALNRGKRSVVLDLKSPAGRAASERLIATADAIVHNFPPDRAVSFGLDQDSTRQINPRAVCVWISAFGSSGPDSGRLGYDLIAQALSGLLVADVRDGDEVPRRSGGIPFADITSGLLVGIAVLAGLAHRESAPAPGVEISLLGAALAAQVQRFVRPACSSEPAPPAPPAPALPAIPAGPVTRERLDAIARVTAEAEELEPYYRCYPSADGFIAVACLNTAQRQQLLDLLGCTDAWMGNPQAPVAGKSERAQRARLRERFAEVFRTRPTAEWVDLLTARKVPASEVRQLDQLFDDEQAQANGLVQYLEQPGLGRVGLLGGLFKIDGDPALARQPAPALGEHSAAVLAEIAPDGCHRARSPDPADITGGDER